MPFPQNLPVWSYGCKIQFWQNPYNDKLRKKNTTKNLGSYQHSLTPSTSFYQEDILEGLRVTRFFFGETGKPICQPFVTWFKHPFRNPHRFFFSSEDGTLGICHIMLPASLAFLEKSLWGWLKISSHHCCAKRNKKHSISLRTEPWIHQIHDPNMNIISRTEEEVKKAANHMM